jgi:PKD repeat protein
MDIEVLPGGDMLYVDQDAYEVKRISYTAAGNRAPTAVATSSITSGVAPLGVAFDGTGSSDPDGDALTYAWDLDGDGAFDDSTAAKPTFTYATAGSYKVQLRVADGRGGSSTASVTITVTASGATTLTFTPDADARVQQANSGSNYGTSNYLQVRGGTSLVTESYVRFQASGITGPVTSAKLRLRALSNGTVDGPALYTASSAWSQSTITWANRPARATTVIGDLGAIAGNATVEYDVTPAVSGDGTITFALIGTSGDGVDFASREYSDSTRRPRLLVTSGG